MGLCKCPKRKVTNQFCFEHRVNVCEHCMVSNHPKCIVQSYCQWLKDSDYNSICILCSSELAGGECVRLVCYHVFHTNCLDNHFSQYPSNTAPAGFTCPSCSTCLFPSQNLVSPVADKLRATLADRPWAREGLELPMLQLEKPVAETKVNPRILTEDAPSEKKEGPPYSVVEVDFPSAFHRNEPVIQVKKSYPKPTDVRDRDENKYKRRPPLAIFKRFFNNLLRTGPGQLNRSRLNKRTIILAIVGIFVLVFLFAVSSRILNRGEDLAPPLVGSPFNHRFDS
nr:EOG090X0ASS [Leptodora kindtii]